MHNEKLLNLTRNKFELSFIDFSRVYRWRDIGWVLYSDELGNFSESVEGSCEGKTFFQWSLEDIYLPTWPFFFFRRGRLRWLDGRHFELREGSRVRGFEGSRGNNSFILLYLRWRFCVKDISFLISIINRLIFITRWRFFLLFFRSWDIGHRSKDVDNIHAVSFDFDFHRSLRKRNNPSCISTRKGSNDAVWVWFVRWFCGEALRYCFRVCVLIWSPELTD